MVQLVSMTLSVTLQLISGKCGYLQRVGLCQTFIQPSAHSYAFLKTKNRFCYVQNKGRIDIKS